MTQSKNRSTIPKSVRHKRILDVAAENPDASLESIASQVPSTTTDLVERVLEKYGDPAEEHEDDVEPGDGIAGAVDQPTGDTAADGAGPSGDPSTSTGESGPSGNATTSTGGADSKASADADDSVPPQTSSSNGLRPDANTTDLGSGNLSVENLSAKQRNILEAIYEHPEATQSELAGMLDVSRTTVYNRVNGIDGLEWDTRHEFVEAIFEDDGRLAAGSDPEAVSERPGSQIVSDDSDSTALSDDPDPQASDGTSGTDDFEAGTHDRAVSEDVEKPTPVRAEDSSLDRLEARVDRLERRVEDMTAGKTRPSFGEAELAHKVVYACLQSEVISKEEELQILKTLVG